MRKLRHFDWLLNRLTNINDIIDVLSCVGRLNLSATALVRPDAFCATIGTELISSHRVVVISVIDEKWLDYIILLN